MEWEEAAFFSRKRAHSEAKTKTGLPERESVASSSSSSSKKKLYLSSFFRIKGEEGGTKS